MMNISLRLGLSPRAVRLEIDELPHLQMPAVLHWNMNHFVILQSLKKDSSAVIADPAFGRRHLSREDISKSFTGVALELRPTPLFKTKPRGSRLRLAELLVRPEGFWTDIFRVLLLSLLLQAFTLSMPLYSQIIIDEVLPKFDLDLLSLLGIGFALFVVVNATAGLLRKWILLRTGAALGFQIRSNLAWQLLQLRTTWFEARHSGDVVSRFSSVTPVQTALTQGASSAILDGLMTIVTLGLMLAYSGLLAFVAMTALCVAILTKTAFFRIGRELRNTEIVAQAKHDTFLIETLKGIPSLRLSNSEGNRFARWSTRMAELVRANVAAVRLQNSQGFVLDVNSGLEQVISLFLAAHLVVDGELSVGMLFAYLSFKQQFLARSTAFLDRTVELIMLRLHLDRLSDIALGPRDRSVTEMPERGAQQIEQVSLSNVSFRFGEFDEPVVRNVSLTVTRGETVAIIGRSGSGKTTLLKIMLGLLTPRTGDLSLNGRSILRNGLATFRKKIAAVLQDDALFVGSISENITMFADQTTGVDHAQVIRSAQEAGMHEEIMQMPMQYDTLIGESGMGLSGGQRQRLMLARALYRNPEMIFLDEGTAQLDEAMAASLIGRLRGKYTLVFVTHSSMLAALADRVLAMDAGKIGDATSSTEQGNGPSGSQL